MSLGSKQKRIAVIAGAGPAGLTAALELLRRSDITPIVLEADTHVGGISKTVNHNGNRMDLGGHRFFSKSDWVMRWWQEILPVYGNGRIPATPVSISYQGKSKNFVPEIIDPASPQNVMLVRNRLSRIFYRRRFFDYPLKLNAGTIRNIGLLETLRIGLSYTHAQICLRPTEVSLEDFFINRFGVRLYQTFFKSYTEKVWGVPCKEISAEWGAQRIKGLSVSKAIAHAVATPFRSTSDYSQKRTEVSLVERFLYPKFGPGQMWEEVARRVNELGGYVHKRQRVVGIERSGLQILGVTVFDEVTGSARNVPCDFLVSTMPIRELTVMLQPDDSEVLRIAGRLPYRDFMTVGLLLKKMLPVARDRSRIAQNGMPPDNWIYIQEPDVKLGRLQIFNNWSPALVADPQTVWLGLEYFCNEGDGLWCMPDGRFIDFAAKELEKIGLIRMEDVLDGCIVRVPKAYPAYFGDYREFGKVRVYLDRYSNLYPIGRNGMHRYNNQDHSMLTANGAVNAMVNFGNGKAAIWDINADGDYHEQMDPSGS